MKIPEKTPIINDIRLENTNLCGYKCFFCPREKMNRPKGIQPIEDFLLVLDRVDEWLKKPYQDNFYLHGYGDPFIDKILPEKVRVITNRWPKSKTSFVTTLGYNVSDEYLEALVKNGLNRLMVSFYGSTPESYEWHTTTGKYEVAYGNLMKIIEIKKRLSSKLKIDVWTYMGGSGKIPELNKGDLEKNLTNLGVNVFFAQLHNFGDGRNYKPSEKKLCHRAIFRNILQITWDLNVHACCMDYNASQVFGNLRTNSIKEILENEKSKEFLKVQCENGSDIYSICKNCNSRTMLDKTT